MGKNLNISIYRTAEDTDFKPYQNTIHVKLYQFLQKKFDYEVMALKITSLVFRQFQH